MNSLVTAVIEKLLADTTLVAMLGKYLGRPSVFGAPPVAPADLSEGDRLAAFPQAVFEGITSDEPFSTKTSNARDVTFDVSAYSLMSGSVVQVNAVAERLRELLESPITIPGYLNVLSFTVAGPVPNDGELVYGRTISVRFILEA